MQPILELNNVHTYYGESQVLQGISLKVDEGVVVAILGRNGMGKTTIIHSIIGFSPPRYGNIRFREVELARLTPYGISRMGIALVPQGRRIFSWLNVKENLTMAARRRQRDEDWTLDRVYSLFPVLKERANVSGSLLSGGEQQMLAIGRALMTNPDLLLLDEPSEGLAPLIVRELSNIIEQLNKGGLAILLVEQNVRLALRVADYVYIVTNGRIVYESTPEELERNERVKEQYLGVAR